MLHAWAQRREAEACRTRLVQLKKEGRPAERHPGLGILHFDAHCDLRRAFEGFEWSHASIFHNVITRIPRVAGSWLYTTIG